MGITPKEPTQYEMTKACTCPEGRCVCKTHHADAETLAYIATLQSENAAKDERIKRLEWALRQAACMPTIEQAREVITAALGLSIVQEVMQK